MHRVQAGHNGLRVSLSGRCYIGQCLLGRCLRILQSSSRDAYVYREDPSKKGSIQRGGGGCRFMGREGERWIDRGATK